MINKKRCDTSGLDVVNTLRQTKGECVGSYLPFWKHSGDSITSIVANPRDAWIVLSLTSFRPLQPIYLERDTHLSSATMMKSYDTVRFRNPSKPSEAKARRKWITNRPLLRGPGLPPY